MTNGLADTRNYLQDIAKVIGKFQQSFLTPDKNYWHVGLEIWARGFQTQEFKLDGRPGRLQVDLQNGIICSSKESWSLGWVDAEQLHRDLKLWLKEINPQLILLNPDKLTGQKDCDQTSALEILNMLTIAQKTLGGIRTEIAKGRTSPLLLYPHHFDLAFSWFADAKQQYTLGLSMGDEHINEPYYYVTAYPETMEFASRTQLKPAYWQKQGFTGVVVKFSDLNPRRYKSQTSRILRNALGL